MKLNPLVVGYRSFNILLLVVSLSIVLIAARKLSLAINVVAILLLVVGVVGAMYTLQHVRTRRGAVLIGCTRRYFVQVQKALITGKALGTVYRPGRGIGLIRELYAHHRDAEADDIQLGRDLRNYISEQGQSINPRETVLFAVWLTGIIIFAGIVAWLLLV